MNPEDINAKLGTKRQIAKGSQIQRDKGYNVCSPRAGEGSRKPTSYGCKTPVLSNEGDGEGGGDSQTQMYFVATDKGEDNLFYVLLSHHS